MKQRSQVMSKSHVAAFAIVAGLFLGATSAIAQDVSVDYDRHADFSRCATYAWAKGQPAQNPLVDKRIVEAIDAALAGKGWKKVQESPQPERRASEASPEASAGVGPRELKKTPGCYVIYQASASEQRGLQIWGSGGRFVGGMGSVDVKTVVNGMMVVDIGDAATGELIWRAVARDTVSDKPEQNEKKLAKCIDKMFKHFPPGSTKS